MVLLGRLPNNLAVDPKGRMVVPSRLRESLGGTDGSAELFVGHLIDTCLYLHTGAQHQAFLAAFNAVVDDTANDRRLKTLLHSSFAPVAMDKSGRLTIPGRLLGRAGIVKESEVVLVGMQERIEIWGVENYAGIEEDSGGEFVASLEAALKRAAEMKQAAPVTGAGDAG